MSTKKVLTINASGKAKKCVLLCVPCKITKARNRVVTGFVMVEARGVEPLSENQFQPLSPGAVNLLEFPFPAAG